ncbi:HNH endonuclease signature motif containing protein [Collimonas sp. H4R21]|uniref:HNH endonuclease signature motif containing protein n=1 Tax=Collimonas rhizosphaerae TaxID=3126357 RepID=A0ABU9PXU0_9BURK
MMPDGGHLTGKENRASIEKSIGAFSFGFSMAKISYKHLYNTKRWYRLRWHQLNDHPLCAMHQALGQVVEATVADHITPHRGDEALFFDEENLQSLCKPCHDGAKQQLEKSGTLRGCDVNGLPLDANHHWRSPRP